MFRTSRRWLYLVFAVLIGLSLAPQARAVFAHPGQQTGVASAVEIVGVIDAIDGKTLTVNGLTIDISKAQINLALTVGAKVKIEGLQAANGLTITAREVNAPKTGIQPGESEIVGVVDSVNGTTIVIGGQTIDISNAEVKAGVMAGKTVKVEFSIDSAGQLVAREVQVVATTTTTVGSKPSVSEENTEITGTLEQVGDGFVIVSGQRFSTNGAEIKGQLVVGVLVKVELRDGETELTAKQIENSHPEDRRRNAGPSKSSKGNNPQVSGGKSRSEDHGGQDDHNGGSNTDDSHDDHGGNSGSGGDSGSGDQGGGHDSGGDH